MNTKSSIASRRPMVGLTYGAVSAALLMAMIPSRASAYDGVTEGRVAVIQYGGGGYDGFGIELVGSPNLCSTGSPFAVWAVSSPGRTSQSPDLVKYLLSAVTSAYLSGRTVRVYADNLPFGDCKLTVIELLPY